MWSIVHKFTSVQTGTANESAKEMMELLLLVRLGLAGFTFREQLDLRLQTRCVFGPKGVNVFET
jgi:hypothetical protein